MRQQKEVKELDINRLKGKIVERGMSVTDLASAIGINVSTLYRKMQNNGKSMQIGEANKIVEALHLSSDEALAIFFGSFVA